MASRFDSRIKALRERLGIDGDLFVDASNLVVRAKLAGVIDDYRIVPDDQLPEVDALWDPTNNSITLRQSIMNGALAEEPRSRFTIAHELAHAALSHPLRNRKPGGQYQHGRFIEIHESEADEFGAGLLAPEHIVDLSVCSDPKHLAAEYGLPIDMAEKWYALLEKAPTNAPRRRGAITPRSRHRVLVDTGNYEDAFWAMSLNAEHGPDKS